MFNFDPNQSSWRRENKRNMVSNQSSWLRSWGKKSRLKFQNQLHSWARLSSLKGKSSWASQSPLWALDVDGPTYFWFGKLSFFGSACSLWAHKMLYVDLYGPTSLICFGFRLSIKLIYIFIFF